MPAAIASGFNVIVRKQTLEDNNYDLRRVPDYPGTGPMRFESQEPSSLSENKLSLRISSNQTH